LSGVGVAAVLALATGVGLARAVTALPAAPAGRTKLATPAVALKTPTVPVKTPTVPVKTPTVPVKTPTVPVKTPTVPVKTPTVPVKTPTVPVKTPTVPVKTPTVPVKTPTIPVKTPAIPVKVPTVPVKTPTVPVHAPTVPVKTSAPPRVPSVQTPSAPSWSTAPKAPPLPRIPGTGAGAAASPIAGPLRSPPALPVRSSARAALGGAVAQSLVPGQALAGATLGAASGGLASAGGGAAQADPVSVDAIEEITRLLEHPHANPSTSAVTQVVKQLAGCLSQLHGRLPTVLRLRAGVGRSHPLSLTAVARRLGVPRRRAARLEMLALRRLRTAAETTSCAARPAALAFTTFATGYLSSQNPAGGVASALYFLPAKPGAERRSRERAPEPPGASRIGSAPAYLLVLFAVVGLLVIALLVADSQGLPVLPGPLARRRRRRRYRSGRNGRG
jgi:hypothetical protein